MIDTTHQAYLDQQATQCNCHECTARWKSSFQGQIELAGRPVAASQPEPPIYQGLTRIYTDLKVSIEGVPQIWRYHEDENRLEVFHQCAAPQPAKVTAEMVAAALKPFQEHDVYVIRHDEVDSLADALNSQMGQREEHDLRQAAESYVVGLKELEKHWPEAECDPRTEELCGYLFANLPIVEGALAKK